MQEEEVAVHSFVIIAPICDKSVPICNNSVPTSNKSSQSCNTSTPIFNNKGWPDL